MTEQEMREQIVDLKRKLELALELAQQVSAHSAEVHGDGGALDPECETCLDFVKRVVEGQGHTFEEFREMNGRETGNPRIDQALVKLIAKRDANEPVNSVSAWED